MTDSASGKLVELVQASVDLANSVKQDLAGDGKVSAETMSILVKYRALHKEVSKYLSVAVTPGPEGLQ